MTDQEIGYLIGCTLFVVIIIVYVGLYIKYRDKTKNKENKTGNYYNEWQVDFSKNQKQQYNVYQQRQYLPYQMITPILTQREKKAYYIILEYCVKNKLALFSKIRMADFITPKNTVHNKDFYFWFNKISAKHVDFLIVQEGSFKPLLAIEIDDETHLRYERQERDIFVDNVYYSIGIPILHIWDLTKEKIEGDINNALMKIIKT